MHIISIGSSSKGNCTFIYNDDTHLLIDAGIAVKTIKSMSGRTSFDALFCTHEHQDHIKNAGPLGRITKTPIYVSDIVNTKMVTKEPGYFKGCIIKAIDDVSSYQIGSIKVTPFSVKHDSAQAFG